jgi:hypothetical protein
LREENEATIFIQASKMQGRCHQLNKLWQPLIHMAKNERDGAEHRLYGWDYFEII